MRTAKPRVIIRHIFILSLLISLCLTASGYWRWLKAESATTTKGLPSLRGEAAITQLKERGIYSSLREAVKASRQSAAPLTSGIYPLLTQSIRLTAADGANDGAPTASGAFNFVIRATDSNGCAGRRQYQIIVN